ncbi:pyridoxamine 5'-phosphate oxidase family protein [Desulforhopalus singaporensis]|uniref:Nitroimidazol reductase NimA, pyridoxamine 5'-phosphate oxidase superfamily n=1 Tax=Desulforhopalus singaporensis TaxID=91360 RepID=A0A1H0LK78_9BACT|nr:pyridoxamine 5'-phosphate oxidase family protein [Desulforhopalus singaporensis]SDO68446.1 hypothetical protein SAMN05660330_00829 [Desulforhopalus singaporensis]
MRELRRNDKQTTLDQAVELLSDAEYGTLSTVDGDGQPYGVPLNYVYRDGAIYFHCALNGHKLDNIGGNPKVSFCVVGDVEVLPAEFSTSYQSVIAFGVASEVVGNERYQALEWLLEKYSSDFMEQGIKYIDKLDKVTRIIKIEVRHVSGKKSPVKG